MWNSSLDGARYLLAGRQPPVAEPIGWHAHPHGRAQALHAAPHAADVNLKDLNLSLLNEEEGLVANRGLITGKMLERRGGGVFRWLCALRNCPPSPSGPCNG